MEQFRIKDAERKIAKIQEDQLADTPLFTRQEAASKVEGLRQVIGKANSEIDRLNSISEVERQSQETVEATRMALEKVRDTNLESASFSEKAELVGKLGINIYPCEDRTNIRIFCGLNIAAPQQVSCHKISMASPKL